MKLQDWIFTKTDDLFIIFVSVFIIFLALLVIIRVAGLRSFAKMSAIDFATTIAVGSILASVSLNPKTPLINGVFSIIIIIGFKILFSFLRRQSSFIKSITSNKPLLLMRDGEIIYKNLEKSNLHKSELIAKLREANVLKFSQVRAVVLESTGDVSVLHCGDDTDLEDRLLDFLN